MKTNRDPLEWIDEELTALERAGLRRQLGTRESPQTAVITLDGRRLINFSSNDYLGLAADREVLQPVRQALDRYGWGSGASPLLGGRSAEHAQLEAELAAFEEAEAALVFPTGYAANVGAISALVERGDAVFSDQKNHASIIDGCRLSGARKCIYPHADLEALRTMLVTIGSQVRRRLIVTDGLFSMDGDVAPLAALADLAAEYDAALMVDEAHATGVLGSSGRGACELAGLGSSAVPIRVGTLSKALGAHGGFVSGSRRLIDWLANRARPFFFSTAAPAASIAAARAALKRVCNQSHRRETLLAQAAELRDRLTADGWDIGPSVSQIIPLRVGDPKRAMQLSRELAEQGLFAPGIRPPTVPEGESMVRLCLSYAHSRDDIDRLLQALRTSVAR